jgi:hypothetical protein
MGPVLEWLSIENVGCVKKASNSKGKCGNTAHMQRCLVLSPPKRDNSDNKLNVVFTVHFQMRYVQ